MRPAANVATSKILTETDNLKTKIVTVTV